ncbi:MAG: hypothetical protein B7C24_00730 [Bacteroidetes bacterium 4572_77]|nr:MAG: hypothetical protein B7C24_00730 [Bacteroidetes bacterium 4572_77]
MIKKLTIFSLLFLSYMAQAQDSYRFAVHFTDKANTPYSIDNPLEYLSQRSLDRRNRAYVEIKEEDLPVDPAYVAGVLEATSDAKFIIEVKWFNAIIISLSDTNNIEAIRDLAYVDTTLFVLNPHLKNKGIDKFGEIQLPIIDKQTKNTQEDYDTAFYGGGWTQIHQLMGEKLHQQNYQGQGKVIAVLDAGFINADTLYVFDKLWADNRVLGTKNMVSPGETVFASHNHGTSVLSTMAGYWPGQLVGTAPEAYYYLIRTEDGGSEHIIEEYNWAAGAAYADSVGADVLNTSLGYTKFDDSRFNHTYEDLDGNSTIITRAANIAYSKGMLPINSAGNSGNTSWRYIGAPADAFDIISVGAVDGFGEIASFSSLGFPWSSEVKPNVVARGKDAYLASAYANIIGRGNGTSFSSPILAGMVASLWSARPSISPYWLKRAIEESSDRYAHPDTLYGYGMPNFEQALLALGVQENLNTSDVLSVYPNPSADIITISLNDKNAIYGDLFLFNIQGQLILQEKWNAATNKIIWDLKNYPNGMYFLKFQNQQTTYSLKINKL